MKRPSPESRHDAPTLTGWFAAIQGLEVWKSHNALQTARALADTWACPVCGEHGAHRCDR